MNNYTLIYCCTWEKWRWR